MTRLTGTRIAGAALFMSVSALAFADTAAGTAAFKRGDIATAYREWKAAADAGDANAEVNLGLLYAAGKGVDRDLAEAMRLYGLAADQGNAQGQYRLGQMYSQGWGVAKSFSE